MANYNFRVKKKDSLLCLSYICKHNYNHYQYKPVMVQFGSELVLCYVVVATEYSCTGFYGIFYCEIIDLLLNLVTMDLCRFVYSLTKWDCRLCYRKRFFISPTRGPLNCYVIHDVYTYLLGIILFEQFKVWIQSLKLKRVLVLIPELMFFLCPQIWLKRPSRCYIITRLQDQRLTISQDNYLHLLQED